MTILINHSTTIKDVQQVFQNEYPFLKIEFADKPHQPDEALHDYFFYDPQFKALTVATKKKVGTIQLERWLRTGNVEQLFENKFGLHAQIFRREKNKWIETSGTDVFSLDEQNEIGQNMVYQPDNYWPLSEHLF